MSTTKTNKDIKREQDKIKSSTFRHIYSERRLLEIWKGNALLLGKELDTWISNKKCLETDLISEDKKFNVIEQLLRKELFQIQEDNKELETKKKNSEKLYKTSLLELNKCKLYPHENENSAFNKEELERMSDEKNNLKTKLKELKEIRKEKLRLEEDMRRLSGNLENALRRKNMSLAEEEKKRIRANEWNRNEMIKKIKEADTSLQKMKKKEVETTKKLSILQNFQLNMELDSHSKKIDKLIQENKKLQHQLNELFLTIGSYKDVEQNFYTRIEKIKKKKERLESKTQKICEEIEKMKEAKQEIRTMFEKSNEQFTNFQNKKVALIR
jgi:hypothetical protein